MNKSLTITILFSLVFLSQNLFSQIQKSSLDNYKLIWQDNFDSKKLDVKNKWTVVVDGDGGGNRELQYYSRKNISVGKEPLSGESCMIIKAKKSNYKSKPATSGRITTQNKMTFQYGKVEARIKMPKTANGLWPAFWLLGSDNNVNVWPKCGEIDIVEMGHKTGIDKNIQ